MDTRTPIDPHGWIQTRTGQAFWPVEFIGEIKLEDIAHSLSQICRFNGHTSWYYSVAQHSVIASCLIQPHWAKWGLLHDAAEAYIGDITRPLKKTMYVKRPGTDDFMSVADLERCLQHKIADRFGLEWPAPWEHIERIDLRLLHNERRILLGEAPLEWNSHGPNEVVYINPKLPAEAKQMFLYRAAELGLI